MLNLVKIWLKNIKNSKVKYLGSLTYNKISITCSRCRWTRLDICNKCKTCWSIQWWTKWTHKCSKPDNPKLVCIILKCWDRTINSLNNSTCLNFLICSRRISQARTTVQSNKPSIKLVLNRFNFLPLVKYSKFSSNNRRTSSFMVKQTIKISLATLTIKDPITGISDKQTAMTGKRGHWCQPIKGSKVNLLHHELLLTLWSYSLIDKNWL